MVKKEIYRQWLEAKKYDQATIAAQMYRTSRVEEYHGDLDEHYANDRMVRLLESLSYSKSDERNNRPNPSKIPFNGDIHNNIASYGNAIKRYIKFIIETSDGVINVEECSDEKILSQNIVNDIEGQRIGLERDMQAALRLDIQQLEQGIVIIDEGVERSVESGLIDITARDIDGITVVIELKAGRARRDAIGQILSYMGDIAIEEDNGKVRGILIASDFDGKTRAAARMVPNLTLLKYSVRFAFSDGHY